MKISVLKKQGFSRETTDLIKRLVDMIPWPAKRMAMGDVTTTILEGKPRVAEKEFGWGRANVELSVQGHRYWYTIRRFTIGGRTG